MVPGRPALRLSLALLVLLPALGAMLAPRLAAGEPPSSRRVHRRFGSAPTPEVTPRLSYYGGPIVHTGTTYLIYWLPPGTTISAGYQSTVNQYFQDIGGSSFYNILSQYYDASGPTLNVSTFGGSWVDPRPYSHAGTQLDPLVDADIEAEVVRAITANPGWNPPGPETLYFVLTGRNVVSCFDSSRSTCSYREYCAYHSSFSRSGATVLYADIPYLTHGIGCDTGGVPPGDADAQVTLSAVAHEHFEMVNDPGPSLAWYDPTFAEIGDICAYNYGLVNLDNTNLSLNGHGYKIQTMWSNADGACVLSFATPAIAALEARSNAPNRLGTPTRLSAAITGGGSAVSYRWDFGDGTSSGPSGSKVATHAYAAGGTYLVTLTATNGSGSASATTQVSIVTSQDFGVAATPSAQTARLGAATSFAVGTTDVGGFPVPITFVFAGLPSGATYSCAPRSAPSGSGSTCTVSSGTAAAGTYSVTIVGASGTISHNTSVSLSLVPCALDAECDDGAFCNGAEVCSAGRCGSGPPASCDDGDPCTDDVCAAGACVHTPVAGPAEVNASVRSAKTDSATTIDWSDAPGPFNVYRGGVPAGTPFAYDHACFDASVPGPSVSDPEAPAEGDFFYYLVTRVGSCSESIPGKDSASAPIPLSSPCP